MNEEEIKQFILNTLYNFFRRNTQSKYKDKFERTEDMIFVSDILKWYFQFQNVVNYNEPQGWVIVGDALDDYVKKAFSQVDRKLVIEYNNYKIIGDPDIVLQLGNTYLIIEVKFSDTVKEYHLMQLLMYMYLLSEIENTNDVIGAVLCVRNNIEIKIMRLDDKKIDFAKKLIDEYISYLEIRRGMENVITV